MTKVNGTNPRHAAAVEPLSETKQPGWYKYGYRWLCHLYIMGQAGWAPANTGNPAKTEVEAMQIAQRWADNPKY